MKRNEKSDVIAKIRKRFQESEAVFVVNQNKMTVTETENLRRRLRDVSSAYLVSKNTLARLAIEDTNFKCILPHLSGQTALVFSRDITGSAKVISEYASQSDDKVVVVCGGYDGRLLGALDVKTLAQLPSMDELRAKIIAVIQTPAQRMATLLQAPACQIARVLKGYSEK
ncbi:MAG: 50S ribosomal protein L10 [Holosporaceae bacterium]|jgi:large subunit ribosomal protein L10|nr:50S ribosomal protein L10 [Holosporaceae bacterium]